MLLQVDSQEKFLFANSTATKRWQIWLWPAGTKPVFSASYVFVFFFFTKPTDPWSVGCVSYHTPVAGYWSLLFNSHLWCLSIETLLIIKDCVKRLSYQWRGYFKRRLFKLFNGRGQQTWRFSLCRTGSYIFSCIKMYLNCVEKKSLKIYISLTESWF